MMEKKMTTYIEVSQALVSAGYLSEANSESARPILASSLNEDLLSMRAEALRDEGEQQQMIRGHASMPSRMLPGAIKRSCP
jgi:hypothetical protein